METSKHTIKIMEIHEQNNIITIKDDICWICKKKFDNTNLGKRSYHHAIERRYKPIKNFKLPLCQRCHYNINTEDAIYRKRYNMIRGVFLIQEKRIKELLSKRK